MLKESDITDTIFCDFANLLPSGLMTVLLRLLLTFPKEISRLKGMIKCFQNVANKVFITLTAFRKIDKFYRMCFFFCWVY